MNSSISVIIATRNSSKTLDKCLSSLKGLNQIIIVDNYSKDSSLDIAKNYNAEIILEKGAGFFGAYNLGFQINTSDYIMFLDSDAYLKNFDMNSALSQFNNLNVGLVVCLAHTPITNTISKLMNDIWYWRMSQTNKYTNYTFWNEKERSYQKVQSPKPYMKMSWLDKQYSKFFMSNNIHSGDTTTGPCYILRREAIIKMGGMNPKGDDFALKRMLSNVGYETRFYISDSVYHISRTTLYKLFREYAHFGLRGAQISQNFFTKKERLIGIFMFSLSLATAPFIAKESKDPRHMLLVPIIRLIQAFGFVVGTLFLNENPERNYNNY